LAAGMFLITGDTVVLSGLATGGGPNPTLRCLNGFSRGRKSVLLPWKKVSLCMTETALRAFMFLKRRCASVKLMLMVFMFTLPGP